MKSKFLKVSIVLITIMTMTMTNFLVIGSSLISYAKDSIATNNSNVEFSAYLENEKGEKAEILNALFDEDLYLDLSINVKNQGYLKGTIALENTNFKLKETDSSFVSKVENNKLTLNQINAGTDAVIRVKIEPIKDDKYEIGLLNASSIIKFEGTYRDSDQRDKTVKADREVSLNLIEELNEETIKNDSKIITNKIVTIDGESKRLVQISYDLGLKENQYPVKEITLEVKAPTVGEAKPEVYMVPEYNSMASSEYDYNEEDEKVTVTLKNTDNKANWKKTGNENVVISYVYDSNVSIENFEIEAKETVKLYDGKEVELVNKINGNDEEKDGIVNVSLSNKENSIYKGKLYSGIERKFETSTFIKINLAKAVEKIEVSEEISKYIEEDKEENANINYTQTKINKNKFVDLFGENGKITIYNNENNSKIAEITKDSEVNEEGNIVVKYDNNVKQIRVETTKPEKEGKLELNHIKTISKSEKETIKNAKEIKTTLDLINNGEKVSSNIKLNESKAEAKLEVDKQTLSTVITNNVEMKVVLKSNSEKYNLYKNPTFSIELPSEIEALKINSIDILYNNGLKLKNKEIQGRTIKLTLEGEQKEFNEKTIEGTTIILNADLVVNRKAATKNEEIKLTYTNENTNGGNDSSKIKVVAPKDITAINSIKDLKVETIGQEENKKIKVAKGQPEKVVDSQIEVINNNENAIENVKILGEFPTNNSNDNMGIKLSKQISLVNGANSKIYYSDNENAGDDLSNSENEWSDKANTDSKKYLIIVDKVESGNSIEGTFSMTIPENLEYNLNAETGYNVKYTNSESKVESIVKSTSINLQTGVGPIVDVKINSDSAENVKNGEVVKFNVEVSNTGSEDVDKVELKSVIPEGATLVEPKENYQYSTSYYKEIDTRNYETTIENLKVGDKVTKTYELRVNNNTAAGTKLVSYAEIKYGEATKKTGNIEKTVEEGKISATVINLKTDEDTIYENDEIEYYAIIKNISNEKQENVKVKTYLSSNAKVSELELISNIEEMDVSDNELMSTEISNEDPDDDNDTGVEYPEEDPDVKTEEYDTSNITQELEYKDEINIGDLAPGESKILSYVIEVDELKDNTENVELSLIAIASNIEHKSNTWIEKANKIVIDLSMVSNTAEQTVKEGDNITYTIKLENLSNTEIPEVNIKDIVPSQLTITKILVDGKEIENNGNKVSTEISVAEKATSIIEIETLVDYSELRTSAESITNVATAEINGEEVGLTESIIHIIQANVSEENNSQIDQENNGNGNNNTNNQTNNNNSSNNNVSNNDITEGTSIISGIAWYDENANGVKDSNEETMSGVIAKLLNKDTNNFVKDSSGKELSATTNEDGVYVLEKIGNGNYIVVFDYDNTKYGLTKYKAEGIQESVNSNAMINKLIIGSEEKELASTDIIKINNNNASYINIGLIELKTFDLVLNKYVSKIVVQTSNGTTTEEYNKATIAKKEIDAKQLNGATVIVEYEIDVTNSGEVEGYARKIADYLPSDLKFSSELNKDWYQSGDTLYTTSLANEKIKVGETKTIKLILTKTMTENNTGLINNRAEIAEDYNELGISDNNSTPGNKVQDENDLGSCDTIISIRTGGVIYITIIIIALIALGGVATVIIKKKKNNTDEDNKEEENKEEDNKENKNEEENI